MSLTIVKVIKPAIKYIINMALTIRSCMSVRN